MTPIEQAIDEIHSNIDEIQKRTAWNIYDSNRITGLRKAIETLQSLLPEEQQFNCDFAEWVGNKGWYWNIDIQKYKKWEGEDLVFATTTELLQLFTNQNQGK